MNTEKLFGVYGDIENDNGLIKLGGRNAGIVFNKSEVSFIGFYDKKSTHVGLKCGTKILVNITYSEVSEIIHGVNSIGNGAKPTHYLSTEKEEKEDWCTGCLGMFVGGDCSLAFEQSTGFDCSEDNVIFVLKEYKQ